MSERPEGPNDSKPTLSILGLPHDSDQATVVTKIDVHPGCRNTPETTLNWVPTEREFTLRSEVRTAWQAVIYEEHRLAARIIANAIHIHRDPATFSVASKIPSGRPATNDDKILRTYVEAHLKLREYMLPLEPSRDGTEWSGSKPLVFPWVNATATLTPSIEHHKWTVSRFDDTSDQRPTLDAGITSSKDLESSESRPPPPSLSGSASQLRPYRTTQPCSKDAPALPPLSDSAEHQKRRIHVQQHAARLDASRIGTHASSAVATGTQGETKSSSPYRRMLSFVKNKTHKGKKPWCSRNE